MGIVQVGSGCGLCVTHGVVMVVVVQVLENTLETLIWVASKVVVKVTSLGVVAVV